MDKISETPVFCISIIIASVRLMIMFLPDLFSDDDEKKSREEK